MDGWVSDQFFGGRVEGLRNGLPSSRKKKKKRKEKKRNKERKKEGHEHVVDR